MEEAHGGSLVHQRASTVGCLDVTGRSECTVTFMHIVAGALRVQLTAELVAMLQMERVMCAKKVGCK